MMLLDNILPSLLPPPLLAPISFMKKKKDDFCFSLLQLSETVGLGSIVLNNKKHVKTLIANVDCLNFFLEDHMVEGGS